MKDIYERLSRDRLNTVKKLEAEGWKFEDDYWESGHNGDPYNDVKFKSPEMNDFVSIGEREWDEITENELRHRATAAIASEWSNSILSEWAAIDISRQTVAGLHKLIATKKIKMVNAVDEIPTEVIVKTSAKPKAPKRVKITIEIL